MKMTRRKPWLDNLAGGRLRSALVKTAFALALLCSLATPLFAADAPPAVPVEKAVELANKALSAKGSPQGIYIASVALKKAALMSKEATWEVAWSQSIPATLPGSREYGLEINMKGEVVHLVKGKAAPTPSAKPGE